LRRQAGRTQLFNDCRIDGRGNGQIEQRAAGAIDVIEARLDLLKERRITEVTADVMHALGERFPDRILTLDAGEFAKTVGQDRSQPIVGHGLAADAKNGKPRRETLTA